LYQETQLMHSMYPGVRPTGETMVLPSYRLDTLLNNANCLPDEIDALVVDVQGAEYRVLLGAGQYLENIGLVECEVSLRSIYQGACDFYMIDSLMTTCGYNCLNDSVPMHGDIVYLNSRCSFESQSSVTF
jgi:hypothetical protein